MRLLFIVSLSFFFAAANAQNWKPAPVNLTTAWGKKVEPGNAWREYPRPQMQRQSWINLNGLWDYAVVEKGQAAPSKYEGNILVPFCIESSLSGVGRPLLPTQEIWYSKSFAIPSSWSGKEIILHFEAVDWQTKLWVNGKKVGEHKGGSDPFQFNITSFLKKSGRQQIVLSVWDPTDTDLQPRGKQSLNPKGIFYTAVSGIWQTVWLEPLNKSSVQQFVPTADIDAGRIRFTTQASGLKGNEKIRFLIKNGAQVVKDTTAFYSGQISVSVPGAQLWTPEHPHMYQVSVELTGKGRSLDRFNSYFAMRKIAIGQDQNGYMRLMLNNQPQFQLGTLDQGWWPESLLTPPSDEAMLFDMVQLKQMGFNMLRKHIKVEPSLYYYHADSLGLLIWQDMPSGFAGPSTPSHVAADAKEDWVRPAESAIQFEAEWKAIMDHLRFFPSIVMWVPLNEGWGQYDTKRLAEWTKAYDPSRLVDAPSGWTDRGVGDVMDVHQYPGPGMVAPSANKGRAVVLGEFGGLGLVVKDHIWNAEKRNWGYKTFQEPQSLISEYEKLMYNMQLMIPRGLAAAIYTQTTDVEGEVNGLMTYDRKVVKIPVDLLRKLHSPLFQQWDGKISFINMDNETSSNKFNFLLGQADTTWVQDARPAGFKDNEQPVLLKKNGSVYAYQDFELNKIPDGFGLTIYGFGDARIYLNGTLIWQEDKIRTIRHYDDINLSDKIKYLKQGKNRIAVSITQATQDTNFDFKLYRLDK